MDLRQITTSQVAIYHRHATVNTDPEGNDGFFKPEKVFSSGILHLKKVQKSGVSPSLKT